MRCQDIQRNLSAYIDGELDSASARRVEHHLGQCGTCRGVAADFRDVDGLVRSLSRLDASSDLAGQLLEMVGESRGPTTEKGVDRSPFAVMMRFMSRFMDLLEAGSSPGTRALEEFDDFPPFSLGSIYLKLLDQPGRG
mgnify:CR=1 FL=1